MASIQQQWQPRLMGIVVFRAICYAKKKKKILKSNKVDIVKTVVVHYPVISEASESASEANLYRTPFYSVD